MNTSSHSLAYCVGLALCLGAFCASSSVHAQSNPHRTLAINAPVADTFTGDVPFQLAIGDEVADSTLKVRLNGAAVSPESFSLHAMPRQCDHEEGYQSSRHAASATLAPRHGCENGGQALEGTLTEADGLKEGRNTLIVSAISVDGVLNAEQVSFYYASPSTGLGATSSTRYMPNSIGLTVNNESGPWVQITTGWAQPPSDDMYTTALPYYDTTFPAATDTACAASDVYQVLVLDRATPTSEIAYSCFGDEQDLATYLQTLTSDEIVIVGTVGDNFASPSLDTTAIGGSSLATGKAAAASLAAQMKSAGFVDTSAYFGNGLQLVENYAPLAYVAIGVGGSSPGTAYESYFTATDPSSNGVGPLALGGLTAHASGTLNYDINGNYSFVSSDAMEFNVTPGDPAVVHIAGRTYESANQIEGYHNGFYLLIMDRLAGGPVNNDKGGIECRTSSPPPSCGDFFPTGEDVNADGSASLALAAALNSVTPRQTAILTTVGTPFMGAASVTADLATAFQNLGGTPYTLESLTTPEANLTFIANGTDPELSNVTGNKMSTFAHGTVEASNLFTQQGQSGLVSGLFVRDSIGLLYAIHATVQSGTTLDGSQDYMFQVIAPLPVVDWPFTTDTQAHLYAYHYISHQILSASPFNMSGDFADDIRYHYPSLSDAVESSTTFFEGTCPGLATQNFTAADYCEVWNELKLEINNLAAVRRTFGNNGLRNSVTAVIGPDAIAASYTVGDGQFSATAGQQVGMTTANWLKLAGSVASVASNVAGLGPLGSLVGGILTLGGNASALGTSKGESITQFETRFDVTLGQSSAYVDAFNANLPIAYDTAMNMVYSDNFKLNFVAQKVENTSSGWQIPDPNELNLLSENIANGASRALYLQLLPKYFWIDQQMSKPVSAISLLGSIDDTTSTCAATYPGIGDSGYVSGETFGDTGGHDFLVFAGTLSVNGHPDMKESMPSQLLLDTLFGNPDTVAPGTTALNFPQDLIIANNLVMPPRTTLPMYSNLICYKPGCTFDGHSGFGPCIGP